jgi:sulfur carrier protein
VREGDDVFAPPRVTPASVVVNGEPHAWRLGLTLADLLAERGSDDAAVATAVNTRFVPRGARAQTPLAPDDHVLVFSAIVGG